MLIARTCLAYGNTYRSMFYLGKRYWISNPGEMCSDNGGYPVMDRLECRRALPFIEAVYPTYSTEDYISHDQYLPDYPKFCFIDIYTEQNRININWNPQPTGRANNRAGQICAPYGK